MRRGRVRRGRGACGAPETAKRVEAVRGRVRENTGARRALILAELRGADLLKASVLRHDQPLADRPTDRMIPLDHAKQATGQARLVQGVRHPIRC